MKRIQGKDFFNVLMNKTKHNTKHLNNPSSSVLSASTQHLPSKTKDITIDINSYHKALNQSVNVHKSILKQILLNQHLSYQKEKTNQNTQDSNAIPYKSINIPHQKENNRYQTLFLMDKSGNDVIKFVCSHPNELNGSCTVKKIETQRACHCPKKVLKSHQRSKSSYTSNGTSINNNSHNKRNNKLMNTLKSSNGFNISNKTHNLTSFTNNGIYNQETPLEDLQKMNEEINTLIADKMKQKEMEQNDNNNINDKHSRKLRISKTSIINNRKRFNIDNINEEDSFIKELSGNNNNNNMLLSGKELKISQNETTIINNDALMKSASAKALFDENEVINRRLEKSGLTKEYLLNAIQRLRELKEDGNSRNKTSLDVNELFNINNFRKQRSSSTIQNKLNNMKPLFKHSKFNPKPNDNKQKGNAPIINTKYVTDKYLNKMKYSGIISDNSLNKIKNLKVKSQDEQYYKNIIEDNN